MYGVAVVSLELDLRSAVRAVCEFDRVVTAPDGNWYELWIIY